jgi:hypothetical protein
MLWNAAPEPSALSAGEPGAAYCRGSALAAADPPLPTAVGLPSVVGYGGRLPSSARGGRPQTVRSGRRFSKAVLLVKPPS